MTGTERAATELRDTTAFRVLARSGFAMNGVLHIIVGGIAIGVAFGGGGEADSSGALEGLSQHPLGIVAIWIIAIGLLALGLFEAVTALSIRGKDGQDWEDRGRSAGLALTYLAIGVSSVRFAVGQGADSSQSQQSATATLLQHPGGVVLVVAIGLGILGAGVWFVIKGVTRRFEKRDIVKPGGAVGDAVEWTGTIGYPAQGVAFGALGVLFVIAAVTADPDQAQGLDGALASLRQLPFGVVVLVVVALGIILYGVYLFARARYARL